MKILSLFLLFGFVKTKSDIYIYGLYTIIGSIGGNVFNFIRLRKYLSVKECIRSIHPLKHLKPVIHVFIFSAITSIYLQLNTVMLGFMKPSSDVGIYTSALKIFNIINGLIASLATVMLPRMSNLIATNNQKEIQRIAQKAYDFSFMFSIPFIVGLTFCSSSIVHLLCGDAFIDASGCVQIMAPIMLFLSVSSLLGYQILYPMGHLNLVIGYCVIGSIVCLCLNLLLIPSLSYLGVSISYMITEFVVAIISIFVSRKYIHLSFYTNTQKNTLLSSFIMGLCLFFVSIITIDNDVLSLMIYFITGIVTYSLILYVRKDAIFHECVNSILSAIKIGSCSLGLFKAPWES